MKRKFFIGKREIKEKAETFIIAEAGVNHNGKLEYALKLVDIAAESGADAVKFQTFKAEQVVTKRGEMVAYQVENTGKSQSQLEMLRGLELRDEFYAPIIERCKERRILFLSTPHGGKASVEFLESLGIEVYKIGSGDLTNFILLEKVAETGKPIILSSGMATLKEVKDSISFIRSKGNNNIAVLHCTTNYPCLLNQVNLLAMKTMVKKLEVPVGYSDHTQGIEVAIMAVTLGAALYECHFTINKNFSGPDHIASRSPEELKRTIEAIRSVKVALGSSEKKPTKSEKLMLALVRRSIVAVGNLPGGYILTEANLEAKRPGDGVSPIFFEKFIGKKLKRNLIDGEQIKFSDLE